MILQLLNKALIKMDISSNSIGNYQLEINKIKYSKEIKNMPSVMHILLQNVYFYNIITELAYHSYYASFEINLTEGINDII